MKNIITLGIALLAMAISYLFGAFVEWDIDAGQWRDAARFSVGMLGLMAAVISAAAYRRAA